jgi:glycosyltransferase involved in cell wall biosynthesis
MKILLFVNSLGSGGAERVTAGLAADWADRGAEVVVVTLSAPNTDFYRLDDRVQRIGLDLLAESGMLLKGLLANGRRLVALRRVVGRERPDVVIGMMTKASILAIFATRGLPCKVNAVEHNHPPMLPLGAVWRRLRASAYKRAASLVALTQQSKAWLEAHCGCADVHVIPNAISLPIPETQPTLAPATVVAGERKILLSVGRLTTQKGFDYLIEAFARVCGEFAQWDLVILGEGEDRAALESRIRSHGLEDRIKMPGRCGNVADWYRHADLYVLSSRFEGFPMTLIEAMACGMAVVSYDCDTGPRDIIKDDVTGRLISQPGDIGALAEGMAALMRDQGTRVRLGRAANEVLDLFAPLRIAKLWSALFSAVGVRSDLDETPAGEY